MAIRASKISLVSLSFTVVVYATGEINLPLRYFICCCCYQTHRMHANFLSLSCNALLYVLEVHKCKAVGCILDVVAI